MVLLIGRICQREALCTRPSWEQIRVGSTPAALIPCFFWGGGFLCTARKLAVPAGPSAGLQ